jgi:aryl-alcohol dehydrogenase-like predicted oxidoreductase
MQEIPSSIGRREFLGRGLATCEELGIGFVPWSPLGVGFLAGANRCEHAICRWRHP